MRGVLFDIDGVLITSWRPLPGAVDAVRAVAAAGHPHVFLTNTTSRTRADIAAALWRCGIDAAPERVVTAGRLTAQYVRSAHPGARCWVLNSGDVAADLEGLVLDEDDPQVVVLGGAGPEFTHTALGRVARLVLDGVPLVAMHRGVTWATDAGLEVDTGAYLALLAEVARSAGAPFDPVVVGKPSATAFTTAAAMLRVEPGRAVMVGDDLRSDVLAAQAAGLVGVLVRTGKFRPAVLESTAGRPDHVLGSVAELPALLAELG